MMWHELTYKWRAQIKVHALLPYRKRSLQNSQLKSDGVASVGVEQVLGQSVAAAANNGSRARSLATSGKRLRLQPYTCCAIAHQVARRPAGDAS